MDDRDETTTRSNCMIIIYDVLLYDEISRVAETRSDWKRVVLHSSPGNNNNNNTATPSRDGPSTCTDSVVPNIGNNNHPTAVIARYY